jgi:crotonobetainyl-CoA:carnitine CoA-transferase CaiB-like acyl-CoA transferase
MLHNSLSGLKVLDFSHVVAGPVCGMWLGDLGADVTKIEALDGELGRSIGPPWQGGESVVALSVNRNKRGLAIDLRCPAGRDAALQMAVQADVVLESFRPGVMDRLGLGYAALRSVNPRLVYCSISAYGQQGALRERPGVDGVIQAVTGLMSTLGEPGGAPCKVSTPIADMSAGCLAAMSVLAALQQRHRTGEGQHLDVSLFNATLMLQQVSLSFFLSTGEDPARSGSAAPYAAPNEAFPTRDGWIMVAAYQPERWRALCQVLDLRSLLDDSRFANNGDRVARRAELADLLGAKFLERDTAAWLELLGKADILCAPIASYSEVTRSRQYRDSGIEWCTDHPVAGTVRTPGFGVGCAPDSAARPAPLTGQHSREVLADYGLSTLSIDSLVANGVIRQAPSTTD